MKALTYRSLAPWTFVGLCASFLAQAQTPIGAPTLQWHEADGTVQAAPALDLDVTYAISGLVAEARVRETFRNTSRATLEGQYLLPLPEGAAVHSLKLRIGERVIEGEIREREQARAEYQAAAAAGQHTSLVERQQANLFRTAVANVAPGEEVVVEVGYWQRVRYQDGGFELSFPLTFVPRYSQQMGVTTDVSMDDGASVVAAPSVDIAVALMPGLPLRVIESPSHPIRVDHQGQGFDIALVGDRVPADRDFVLRWTPEPSDTPSAALFVEHRADADYAMVMMVPPRAKAEARLPRELILVIDTSGSMLGVSMEQAKAAARMALTHLAPSDRVNVIEFNSVTRAWRESPVAATAEQVRDADAWIANLKADGGTEMRPALETALLGEAAAGYVRQIVFATDGAVTDEDGLYTLIEQRLGASRLFPVGIGDAPNAHFLDTAARMGRGASVVIRDIGEVDTRMGELYAKLDSPVLRDLAMNWPGVIDSYPQKLPDLYQGEPLLAVARLTRAQGEVSVSGRLKRDGWSKALNLKRQRNDAGVALLWAQSKVEALEDELRRGQPEDTVRARLLDVALTHGLVTRYTSLVAVDKTPREKTAPTVDANAANDDALAFAQGATPAPMLLLIGLGGLLMLAVARPRRATALA